MLTRLRESLGLWSHLGTRESADGSQLIGHTPRDFPEAYLHRYFAALPASAWAGFPILLPAHLQDFYRACNGLSIFRSLSLWGLRGHYTRNDSAQFQPFDLLTHHEEWCAAARSGGGVVRDGTIFFGSYSWDGSGIYVVGDQPQIHRSAKGSADPLNTWPDLTSFLAVEYDRLAKLFTPEGYAIDPRAPRVPAHAS
jgi:hypothetical protein